MRVKTEKRATEKNINKLIEEYSQKEKVLEILYTGKLHTLLMLEHGLRERHNESVFNSTIPFCFGTPSLNHCHAC